MEEIQSAHRTMPQSVRSRVAFEGWLLLSERHVLKWRGRRYVAVSASILADQTPFLNRSVLDVWYVGSAFL